MIKIMACRMGGTKHYQMLEYYKSDHKEQTSVKFE